MPAFGSPRVPSDVCIRIAYIAVFVGTAPGRLLAPEQARFSAESPFAGAEGNQPLIFTAVLNKKGKPSAISERNYFVTRVQRSLDQLR